MVCKTKKKGKEKKNQMVVQIAFLSYIQRICYGLCLFVLDKDFFCCYFGFSRRVLLPLLPTKSRGGHPFPSP